ncbi:hypothetical protein GCM10009590_11870 [Brachybacterium alimentarium]
MEHGGRGVAEDGAGNHLGLQGASHVLESRRLCTWREEAGKERHELRTAQPARRDTHRAPLSAREEDPSGYLGGAHGPTVGSESELRSGRGR